MQIKKKKKKKKKQASRDVGSTVNLVPEASDRSHGADAPTMLEQKQCPFKRIAL
jgi:hypothetical protein